MRAEERTFVAVKPDGVQRGLVGEVIKRLETKGYKIVAMKMLQATDAQAKAHYEEHKDKPFFPRLIQYLQSALIVPTSASSGFVEPIKCLTPATALKPCTTIATIGPL